MADIERTSTTRRRAVGNALPTEPLGPRHTAGRVVGPVAVEPDDTPFDAPANAQPAGVFQDRIMDDMPSAVGDLRDAMTESAGNRLRCAPPGPERNLTHPFDADNLQVRRPVLGFLVGEFGTDLTEDASVVTQRDHSVVARAGQAEVEFEDVRGGGRTE